MTRLAAIETSATLLEAKTEMVSAYTQDRIGSDASFMQELRTSFSSKSLYVGNLALLGLPINQAE